MNRPQNPGRRELLALAAAAPIALGVAPRAEASSATPPPVSVAPADPRFKPLAFDPAKLKGLSERLIRSHWENNYGGSVKALAATRKYLADALANPDMPPYLYNELKREHLLRTGSVVLHEHYFDNLGGDGRPDADTRKIIGDAFGSFDRWEMEFRRMGLGLGGGSGWVMLGYNTHLHQFENYWMADHAHAPAATLPILVLDMYEHAYHMDYGAVAAKYVDAFFENIQWDVVAQRLANMRPDAESA
jgi:Fe-Mn family superoxide dismutase